MKQPKIIHFIDGPVPTPYDKQEVNAMRGKGALVMFRNARFVGTEGGGVEEIADGVSGAVPASYADHAKADEAIGKYHESLKGEAQAILPLSGALAAGGAATGQEPAKVAPGGFTAPPTQFTAPS